jgi:hypothetical protein
MKSWKTTDGGPYRMQKETGPLLKEGARNFLTERNGGLPPNLHLCNRAFLLQTIARLQKELLIERAKKS